MCVYIYICIYIYIYGNVYENIYTMFPKVGPLDEYKGGGKDGKNSIIVNEIDIYPICVSTRCND
jgi:hypothetical protein